MTGSVTIDVVIGLIFVYLLYSLLATVLQEIVASYLRLRAKCLERAIKRMLDDEGSALRSENLFSSIFYDHSIIKYLGEKNGKKPSYLDAKNFSKCIVDLLRGNNPIPGQDNAVKITDGLTNGVIPQGETLAFIKSLWADANTDIEKFRSGLEEWFDQTMDRASGWYKKQTQKVLLLIGLVLAVIFDVNTLHIVHNLSTNPKLTAQLVQQADNFLRTHPDLVGELASQKEAINQHSVTSGKKDTLLKATLKTDSALRRERRLLIDKASSLVSEDIQNANAVLGIGINNFEWNGCGDFLKSLFGWILTALAISLGAPFWFDLLNKMMKLRTSVAASSAGSSDKDTSTGSNQKISPKG